MKLFVPGRICLFGEHTDWAGSYRRINGELEPGHAIITGTNQGLHAEVKPHPNKLVVKATLSDGTPFGPYEVPMDRDILLAEAQKGGFFSYAAGVAYQVLTHYRVRGLEINNYLTDLPIKKGLSSSAAVCVMVARAFNRLYDLKMTVRGEMEFAYLGEITTPSRCGRMDQGCAYGSRPIMLTFDGDRMDVTEVTVPRDLFFVIVDLHAGKDTREILNHLNHCYPFAEDSIQKGVQKYLGPISAEITRHAAEAMREGDAQRIGELMRTAQTEFDRYCMPACPTQLTSPILHKVLNHPLLQPLILGGKGVGSQGDGSAQFIVRDEASQEQVIRIIEQDLKMSALRLVMQAGRRLRKAVIPAAGFGTRLFPATKAIKKELFPIMDSQGRMKPAIQIIVEEAVNAGIEEVGLIVQTRDKEVFGDFFYSPPPIENFNKLSRENQEYSQYLLDVGRHVKLLSQDTQEGFGHAVYCARDFVKEEPFLLMLGDHLYASEIDRSCVGQLLDVYEKTGQSVVGLKAMPADLVKHFGCVTGIWQKEGEILNITEFAEKPDIDYARTHLQVDGLAQDTFLTVFGIYIIKPQIFHLLEENINNNIRERGEFQLTSCLDELRKLDGFSGCVVKGRRFDIGLPDVYRQTMIDYPNT
jgi:UTP-glucose-1-phosphate uridylyltransferase/galactokinase